MMEQNITCNADFSVHVLYSLMEKKIKTIPASETTIAEIIPVIWNINGSNPTGIKLSV